MITSLGRTASPFSSCRAEWCRRALATSAYAETSSTSPMPPKLDRKTHKHNGRVSTKGAPPKIFVRPWDGVPSMLDGFAMLRGIENKYGKVKAFKFIRDGEIPSTYFSYFWVELEDPSRYSDAGTTILQVPVPEVERKRPGGIGIADLQPFLRPSPKSQEEAQEWQGVTERMVDEVDESKRKNKMYDLRLEPSVTSASRSPYPLDQRKYYLLSRALVKWGGFASSPSLTTTGSSTRPTFDHLMERGSRFVKTDNPTTVEDESPPPAAEEPHKPFNYNFDEPANSTETQASASSRVEKAPSAQPKSLLTMQREGKRLSKKQKALLQAAAISRTPLPNLGEKALAGGKENEERPEAKEAEATSESRMETDEEKKQFQSKVWDLVRSKWF